MEKLIFGDIVLTCDDKYIPRNQWRLGKVEELIIRWDGNIRGAKLVVVFKSANRSICYRPSETVSSYWDWLQIKRIDK